MDKRKTLPNEDVIRSQVAEKLQALFLLGRAISPLEAEKRIEPKELTHSELVALECLYWLEKAVVPVSAGSLAAILNVSKTRMSHILSTLEGMNPKYITRRYEGCKRLILELTDEGKAIAEQAINSDVSQIKNLLKNVTKVEKLTAVQELLDDIQPSIVKQLRTIGHENDMKPTPERE